MAWLTSAARCRAAAQHLQRIVEIMPRLAERLQAPLESLQAAAVAVDQKQAVDHPKHALLRDQLLRISAHQAARTLPCAGVSMSVAG